MTENFKKDLQKLVNKYPEIKLKDIQEMLQEYKKPLPKTWEEAIKNLSGSQVFYIDNYSNTKLIEVAPASSTEAFKNSLLSEKRAEEVLALIQLITLRDIYNDGWEPDWSNYDETKYCIYGWSNTVDTDIFSSDHCILVFKTEELRDEFFKNFKDLIEKAKYLL